MIKFNKHNQYLKDLILNSMNIRDIENITNAVDLDTIDTVLRNYLTKEEIYLEGLFFTGQNLASTAVSSLERPITFSSVVLDPTCGAGNLLIECSRMLGVEEYLSDTLKKWGYILRGFDVHKTFIDASKLRIVIEALRRGCILNCSIEEALSYLKNIKLQDAMDAVYSDVDSVTHLVMNPPFNSWPSPNSGIWKQGKVNAAGVVFAHYINLIKENSCICAILPEVLRSGSRYSIFRKKISEEFLGSYRIWGRFNKKTDVDVFILSGIKSNLGGITWHNESTMANATIADEFEVSVGPLVAYRDPEVGPEYPYVNARNVEKWTEITSSAETRRFKGRVITPPFVVVKRTSSPTDAHRAAAAIINTCTPVAVENHLIVLKPKSGKLRDCRKVIKILSSDFVNDFLNQNIRMRHLTIPVVKSIPLV